MVVSTIYIVRHGFRSNWVAGAPLRDPPTGIKGDPVLAEHGVAQAGELALYLKDAVPKVQEIFSSPFYRCVETIAPLAEALDLPIEVEAGIGEWYAKGRADIPTAGNAKALSKFFPRIDTKYESLVKPDPTGEKYSDLFNRTFQTLEKLIVFLDTHHPEIQTILFCTHAATKITLGRALTGNSDYLVRTGVCSIDMYVRPEPITPLGGWIPKLNGYTGHLSKGEERHWSFEEGSYDLLDKPAS